MAVPTTAGTGSEGQSFALIADPESHMKMACGDRKAAFRVSILDPELTVVGGPFTTATAFTETGSQFADEFHGSNGFMITFDLDAKTAPPAASGM